MWCENVAKVEATLDIITTPSTLTASTEQTPVAYNMVADANMIPTEDETIADMTGKVTGNITSALNPSPLTMLEFSDIESENEER
jgi:hypothetical protein